MNNRVIEITNILDVEKYVDGLKVIIFDMDDTLYSEKEYVRSGYRKIAEIFQEIGDAEETLWKFFLEKKSAIDEFLNQKELFTEENKEACIKAYRFQEPDIHMYFGVREMLTRLIKQYHLALITDGRPEGQRAKIKALGLDEIFEYIILTDELGGIEYRKPNETAYRTIAGKFNVVFSEMGYVGDNIKKDFIAPIKLGMRSIWFQNSDGLYREAGNEKGSVVV